jgi:hypothetical protein
VAERVPPRPLVKAILTLRRGLLGLADRLVPPHLAIFDKTIGIGRTHLYGAIAEVGIADELAKGKATAEELAERLDLNADAVHRVLRAGAVEGAVKMDRRASRSRARARRSPRTTRTRCTTGRAIWRSA